MLVPTIRVRLKGGTHAVINESDFDPRKHERYVEPSAKPEPATATEAAADAAAPGEAAEAPAAESESTARRRRGGRE